MSDDGGPAFPGMVWEMMTEENQLSSGRVKDSCVVNRGGMTLRDYFAAAIAPTMGDWRYHAVNPGGPAKSLQEQLERVAADAYLFADAMLKERAK